MFCVLVHSTCSHPRGACHLFLPPRPMLSDRLAFHSFVSLLSLPSSVLTSTFTSCVLFYHVHPIFPPFSSFLLRDVVIVQLRHGHVVNTEGFVLNSVNVPHSYIDKTAWLRGEDDTTSCTICYSTSHELFLMSSVKRCTTCSSTKRVNSLSSIQRKINGTRNRFSHERVELRAVSSWEGRVLFGPHRSIEHPRVDISLDRLDRSPVPLVLWWYPLIFHIPTYFRIVCWCFLVGLSTICSMSFSFRDAKR